MTWMKRLLPAACVLLVSTTCSLLHAEPIYKHVDAQGNVTYSDSPMGSDDQAITLPPVNTQNMSEGDSGRGYDTAPVADEIDYQMFIDLPENDSSIPPGQTSVVVSGHLDPAAEFPAEFALVYDGQVIQTSGTPQFSIPQLFRGSHSISIQVIDDQGVTIANSSTVTIHVVRPTVAN